MGAVVSVLRQLRAGRAASQENAAVQQRRPAAEEATRTRTRRGQRAGRPGDAEDNIPLHSCCPAEMQDRVGPGTGLPEWEACNTKARTAPAVSSCRSCDAPGSGLPVAAGPGSGRSTGVCAPPPRRRDDWVDRPGSLGCMDAIARRRPAASRTALPDWVGRRRIDVHAYHRMGEAGIVIYEARGARRADRGGADRQGAGRRPAHRPRDGAQPSARRRGRRSRDRLRAGAGTPGRMERTGAGFCASPSAGAALRRWPADLPRTSSC